MTYAYNAQAQTSTTITPFLLDLTRYQPGPTTLDKDSAMVSDNYRPTEPQALEQKVLVQIDTSRSSVSERPRVEQIRYKKTCERYVVVTTTFSPVQVVCIHKQQYFTSSAAQGNKMAISKYKKRTPRTTRPSLISGINSNKLTINRTGIENKVLKHCATLASVKLGISWIFRSSPIVSDNAVKTDFQQTLIEYAIEHVVEHNEEMKALIVQSDGTGTLPKTIRSS